MQRSSTHKAVFGVDFGSENSGKLGVDKPMKICYSKVHSLETFQGLYWFRRGSRRLDSHPRTVTAYQNGT